MSSVILLNKPFRVLSQFTDRERDQSDKRETLADYLTAPGFRPAGRLDYDSEGLVLLTDDGQLQQRIANPKYLCWKTYWVQVEGVPSKKCCERLASGLMLNDGMTLPAKCRRITAPRLWNRVPPIRERKQIPDSWIEVSISEGRNRQVRRMTAAVGHPTLRLVRIAIDQWHLGDLLPGEHIDLVYKPRRLSRKIPSSGDRKSSR